MSLIIPNTFATKTGAIQLSLLDENFTEVSNYLSATVTSITLGGTGETTRQAAIDALAGDTTSGQYLRGNGTDVVMSIIQTEDILSGIPGNWFRGVAKVKADGVMEVGRYIDFHNTNTGQGTSDFDARIDCTGINAITFNSATVTAGAFRAPEMYIQTVYTKYTSKATYAVPAYVAAADGSSNGTYIDVLQTTITPKISSSRIKIELNISFEVHQDTIFRLFRSTVAGGDVQIGKNDDNNRWSGFAYPGYDVDNASTPSTNHYIYIDSPDTTSAVTYRLMIQSTGVGATTFFLNRTVAALGQSIYENAISQVVLTEIV